MDRKLVLNESEVETLTEMLDDLLTLKRVAHMGKPICPSEQAVYDKLWKFTYES